MEMKEKIDLRIKFNILFIVVALIAVVACFIIAKSLDGSESVTFNQSQSIDYTVCFEPNEFYEEECLPKTINNYVARYIDTISVNFDYKLSSTWKFDTDYKYSVMGLLTIFDRNNENNIMNKREYTFVEETKVTESSITEFRIQELVKLNYSIYNDFVNDYKTSAAIPANANLRLTFKVESENDFSGTMKPTSQIMTIDIPLGEPTIQLIANYVPSTDNVLEVTKKPDVGYIITMFVAGFIFAINVALLLFNLNKKNKTRPVYERFVEDIKKEFDADISELKSLIDIDNDEGYTYLDVANFKELYDEVKKSSSKQIYWNERSYHAEGKRINRVSWFFVILEDKKVLRFEVMENRITSEYKDDPDILKKYRG